MSIDANQVETISTYLRAIDEDDVAQMMEKMWQEIVRLRKAEAADLVKHRDDLLDAMTEVRHSIQFATDSPGGAATGPIDMMHEDGTVLEFIDSAIAKVKGGA